MDFKIGLGGGGGDGVSGGGGAASSNNASSCSDDDNAPSAKLARTTATATATTQQQAQSFHQLMMLRKQQQCCSPTDSTAASSGDDALLAPSSRPHQQLMLPPTPPAPAHSLSPLEHQQGVYQYKQAGCGGMQLAMSLQEAALGPRYPFSAVQWAELEHQALVFKYMMARVPPPPELIAPIRKSVAALQGLFHAGSTTTAIGGTHVHHLDLEPGRCRRTDGKKWRCARPIVPDQKYCERHINRGKHKRSNKNSSNNNANSNDNNANRSTNSSNQRSSSSQPVAVGAGGLVPAVEPLQSRFPVATITNSAGQQPTTSSMASLSQPMRSFSSVNGSHQHLIQQQRQQQLYTATPNLSSKDRFLSGPVCAEQLLFSEVSGSTKPVATSYVRPQAAATQSQYYYESRTPTSTTTTEEGDAFYVSSGSSSFLHQRDRQQHSYLASQQQEDVKRLKPLFKEWPSTSSSNSDEKDIKVKESGVNLSMNNISGRDEQDYTSALGGPLAEALHKAGGEQRQRSSDDKPTAFWLSDAR